MEPPRDLSLWVGALVLAAVVPEALRRFLARGDKAMESHRVEMEKADATWRAEVKSDLKRLLDGQQDNSTSVKLLEQTQAQFEGRLAQLEKRQTAQAEAHLAAVDKLRSERKRR